MFFARLNRKRAFVVQAMALTLLILSVSACGQEEPDEQRATETPATSQETPSSTRTDTQGKIAEAADPAADATPGGEDLPAPNAEDPTVTPEPGKMITVCLPGAINDLYLYGDQSAAATAVRRALYEAPFSTHGYAYQAQALEKMPGLSDGDAQRLVVMVNEGDRVVDATGAVVTVRRGVRLVDATGETVEFANEPLWMEQIAVDFTFQPHNWSDGTPVTAADSVFSYNLAADPASPIGKEKTNFTASYEATGDRTVRWMGLPGYLDPTYATNAWTPLPSHLLGDYSAAELRELEIANRPLVGSGPYVISEWRDANEIHLVPNHAYYRTEEGLPRIANVTVRLGSLDELLTGTPRCDVIAGDALGAHNLPDLQAAGSLEGWEVLTAPGNVVEQLAFGVNPVSEYADRRPDWFEDSRVRQAIAQCTDREGMSQALTGGAGVVVNSLVPDAHPLTPSGLEPWSYDPEAANALLDEAGYLDFAEDGRRQDVSSGVPMTVTVGTNSESAVRLRIIEMLVEDLGACGIPVVPYDRPAGTWFGSGPQGPLFGRQFDLAQLAWVAHTVPDCGVLMTGSIPGPAEFDFGGWTAPNISGWSDEAYDQACRAARSALPGGEGYAENMAEVLRLVNQALPVLPLFTNYEAVAVRPGVQNVQPDATQQTALWNIAQWDIEE